MILHVDMDAFYASVEEREQPELIGRPVIVAGSPQGRGVVAAASYAARKFGVHSAIPTSTALRLCPQAIVIAPRHGFYAQVSDQIREILLRYTPLVEPLSLDEAFLDVTGCEALFGSAVEIGRRIKREIRDELRLTASVGVAPNKFLAKIASDLKKPDGFVVVDRQAVQAFLDPLPVGRLWGVGRVTGAAFEKLGLRTIADVRQLPVDELRRRFGEWGEHLAQLARGIDDRPVVPDREAKSISHETTFAVDLDDCEILRSWLRELTEHVGCRLRRHGLKGRTVNLKVRFADFQTITRAKTLPQPTDITDEIWTAAAELLATKLPAQGGRIRLIGVGVSGFEASAQVQQSLFPDAERERRTQLDAAADQIRERFGAASLNRGSGLLHETRHKPLPRPEALP
ncbi:MAG: DNA polymerase IV [Planctomycetaceae bacterium]|nr:DNA polymerase IV [Planctomycetaceae bacterium]